MFFPPTTGGGAGWIKVRLISNPGLLLLLLFSLSFLQFSPCSCQVAVPLLRGGFIHEEEGRGGKQAKNENGSCLFTRSHDSMPIKRRHSVGRLSPLIRHPSADRTREGGGGSGGPAGRKKRPGEEPSCPGTAANEGPFLCVSFRSFNYS